VDILVLGMTNGFHSFQAGSWKVWLTHTRRLPCCRIAADGGQPENPERMPRHGLPGGRRLGKACREGAARLAPQTGSD
jgi:hypothetical protein